MPRCFKLLFVVFIVFIQIYPRPLYLFYIRCWNHITSNVGLWDVYEKELFPCLLLCFYWILVEHLCNPLLILFLAYHAYFMKLPFYVLGNWVHLLQICKLNWLVFLMFFCEFVPNYFASSVVGKYAIIWSAAKLDSVNVINDRIYFVVFDVKNVIINDIVAMDKN